MPHLVAPPKVLQDAEELHDDLLISTVGAYDGGLLAIPAGRHPILHTADRLSSNGLWLDCDVLIRALNNRDRMILFVYLKSGRTEYLVSEAYKQIHDVRYQFRQLYLVSTGTNEVVQLDTNGKLLQRWKFPGDGDCWHLNCLDLWNGRYVVSCFGRFERHRQFIEGWKSSGIVFDLETGAVLWDGLSMPHTPRTDRDGRQYICDSGAGRLLIRDPVGGSVQEIPFPNTFPRGLAFGRDHIYVGLSTFRANHPELHGADETKSNAKIAVLEYRTFKCVYEINLPCQEVYDIIVTSNKKLSE